MSLNFKSLPASRSQISRYAVAVLAVMLALAFKLTLDPLIGRETPFLLFFGAVTASAWYGGLVPGLLATALAAVASSYFFLPPYYSLAARFPEAIRLVIFMLEGALVSSLSAAMQASGRRAAASAREAQSYQKIAQQREAIHRLMIEEVKDFAIIMMDTGGRVTSWNKGAENVFGYEEAEASGQHTSFIFTPEDIERGTPEDELRTALAEGQAEDERWHLRKDGTRFWASGVMSATRDDAGELRGFAKVARDITHRKKMEEALLVAEQRAINEYERLLDRLVALADVLGAAHDLITIFRALRDFAVSSVPCNGTFVSLYDEERNVRTAAYGWGDGAEINVAELPPMPITADGPNSMAVTTGEVIITDDYQKRIKGHNVIAVGLTPELLPQSTLVAPMKVMNRVIGTVEVQSYEPAAYRDEHVAAMRIASNLTAIAIENARLLEHESSARAAAEAGNRIKDEFLATLSHELRTPLTSILGWAHLLRTGRLGETENARAIETIERNARAQTQLIDDLLDVSRIITGKLRLSARPTKLAAVITAAIDVARPAAEAKAIRLETELDEINGLVSGDPDRLQQVVWNLLSNAIKFTPEGGRVHVQLARSGSHASIQVSDTGKGISANFLPHVFDRFRQADSTTTRQHGGLGLGLAIVRQLVELHGGTVRVASEGEERGTIFTVELPLMSVRHEEATTPPHASYPNGTAEISGQRLPALKGTRVLVVDDETDSREIITMIFSQSGAEVTAASSAGEAFAEFQQRRPDVLVSDIGMPVEDGYALIAKLRALPFEQGGSVPAIALTAYARTEDKERALAAGYQMHVAKPVEPVELINAVARLIEKNGKE
ncbi:MAG: ATP-binding protein [Pyrinomonadaceae bacterium]